ncbi:tRNA(Ile)-lysidine synthase [Hypnocyclicus thermotrophus]|uniref:tRNA(Ile)-lysidine synthase n=1 Tax=Hypnocyclicus thermotrophus TaxID=1627895 RepID=A0AA46DY33_9FUSO|nr:tRNA lysidine(34) synthetase TilS [Hypnocyclicus thermotrophus]TDT68636.1 tRNA(Ile)-lysidine synthase [Hypnocyclicus thermotrophus]
MRIYNKFLSTIQNNNLISKNDKIIIALSGGPDSVCLFHLLYKLQSKYNLSLYFAHINHNLRGIDADLDEQFVIELGKKYNIPTFIKSVDIKKYATSFKLSEEEAGREVRYNFFKEIKNKIGANKVALAHILDDNVETFMFRLSRGTSIDGLCSIPVKRDYYIRPLLYIKKEEILKFLEENNLRYQIDESNFKSIYTRNKIRLELIPYFEKEFNSNFKDKIISLIDELNDINKYFKKEIDNYINNSGKKFDIDKLISFPEYLQKEIIKTILKNNNIAYNRKKINKIFNLLYSNGSKEYLLNEQKKLYKIYNEFYISDNIKILNNNSLEKTLKINSNLIFNNYYISIRESDKYISKNNVFCIDKDKILHNEFLIRTRKKGDFFIPIGSKNKKKLKDFFINEKIDKYKRNSLPLIINNDKIVCVGNIRLSEEFKTTTTTKKFLIIELKEVETNE